MIHIIIDDTSENNECSSNATEDCEQICTNTPGSYICQCNAGFRLNVDGRTCDGIKAFVTSIAWLFLELSTFFFQISMNVVRTSVSVNINAQTLMVRIFAPVTLATLSPVIMDSVA